MIPNFAFLGTDDNVYFHTFSSDSSQSKSLSVTSGGGCQGPICDLSYVYYTKNSKIYMCSIASILKSTDPNGTSSISSESLLANPANVFNTTNLAQYGKYLLILGADNNLWRVDKSDLLAGTAGTCKQMTTCGNVASGFATDGKNIYFMTGSSLSSNSVGSACTLSMIPLKEPMATVQQGPSVWASPIMVGPGMPYIVCQSSQNSLSQFDIPHLDSEPICILNQIQVPQIPGLPVIAPPDFPGFEPNHELMGVDVGYNSYAVCGDLILFTDSANNSQINQICDKTFSGWGSYKNGPNLCGRALAMTNIAGSTADDHPPNYVVFQGTDNTVQLFDQNRDNYHSINASIKTGFAPAFQTSLGRTDKVYPLFNVVRVIYAPPGSAAKTSNGPSPSVTYSNTSSTATTTTMSSSLSGSYGISASFDDGEAGASGGIKVSSGTSASESTTKAITFSDGITVFGSSKKDGISHALDQFFVIFNPELTVKTDTTGNVAWGMASASKTRTWITQKFIMAQLKNSLNNLQNSDGSIDPCKFNQTFNTNSNDEGVPNNVFAAVQDEIIANLNKVNTKPDLSNANLTKEFIKLFVSILSTNPYADKSDFDPTGSSRFCYLTSFNYSNGEPGSANASFFDKQVEMSKLEFQENSVEVETSVSLSEGIPVFEEIEETLTMTWSSTSSKEQVKGTIIELNTTIVNPSKAWGEDTTNATNCDIYIDTVYSTLLFTLPKRL
jgi:hypothetical protein